MIREALAGKRIAVTGTHRLPRHHPGRAAAALGARLRARAARPSRPALHRRPAGQAGDLQERRLRPAPRRARQGRLRRDGRPAGHRRRRRRRHRRPRPRRRTAGPPLATCDIVIHSAATVSLRLAARRRRRGQPPRPDPHRRRCSTTSASRPTSSPCPPATSPATAAAPPPRSSSTRARSSSTSTGAGEVEGARRARADAEAAQPHARDARRASASRPARSSAPPACPLLADKTEQLREPLGHRPHGRGRPGPGRLARLARRLRLHQGPRRAGAAARTGATCPVSIVRPVDHRVGAGRAPPGLDPRLPHGRAGHHLLRPRPAEGVPRRARGHRRRHPGRPRRRRHHRRRRHGPRARAPTIVQVASGSQQPAALPPARRPRRASGSPSTRSTTPRASPSSCPSGRSPAAAGCRASSSGPRAPLERAERVLGSRSPCGASRPRGRPGSRSKREEVERALGYVELYGAYAECEAIYGVDHLLALWDAPRRRRPARPSASTPGSSTGTTTSTRSTCRRSSTHARVRTTPGGRTGREPRGPPARARCSPPSASWRPSTSRTRSSPPTSWRRYSWLATRRLPPDDRAPLRRCRRWREGPGAARPRPPGPQRLPPPLLPPLRGRPGRPDRRGRRRDVQPT